MSRKIPIEGTNKVAIVSNKDYKRVIKFRWILKFNSDYVYCEGDLAISLHGFILNLPKDYYGDHKDHNPLNNTRKNLRIATCSQNAANMLLRKGGKSKYKGVTKNSFAWVAQITVRYKPLYLGSFQKEKDAALAYDKAALFFFREFALTNYPVKTKKKHISIPQGSYRKLYRKTKKSNPYIAKGRDKLRKERAKKQRKIKKDSIKLEGNHLKIKLWGKEGKGKYAIADKDIYNKLINHKWVYSVSGRCRALISDHRRLQSTIYLHYLVIKKKKGYSIGYKNKNSLDFRKKNLYYVSNSLKSHQRKVVSISGYKGIRYTKDGTWRVTILSINLGTFKSLIIAMLAYDKASNFYFKGEANSYIPSWKNYNILKVKNIDKNVKSPEFQAGKSKNIGIKYNQKTNKFGIWIDTIYIGTSSHEDRAVIIYEVLARELLVGTKFLNYSNKVFKRERENLPKKMKKRIHKLFGTVFPSIDTIKSIANPADISAVEKPFS